MAEQKKETPITTEEVKVKINEKAEESSPLISEESKNDSPKETSSKVEEIEIKVTEKAEESSELISEESKNGLQEKTDLIDLVKIISALLDTDEKIEALKVKVKITDSEISFMKKLLETCPDLFQEISKSLGAILEDKVIDTKDIPYIITIVKDSYKTLLKTNTQLKKVTLEDSLLFIKHIILILIEYDHIKVDNKENIDLLIELCIDLLRTNLDLKVNLFDKLKECFSCFKK